MKKVYIGVSGGIDSAAALLMLIAQGYQPCAIYFSMLSPSPSDETITSLNELTAHTGVPVEIYDASKEFSERIIKPYISACKQGIMLSPCAICNKEIKWRLLAKIADQRGGGLLATGHYCRTKSYNGHTFIQQGLDPTKDQSYYLWALEENILRRAIFPLGDLTKDQVREYMIARGWSSIAQKKQSMGVCFFKGLKFADWLISQGVEVCPGDVFVKLDADSIKKVGTHSGFPFYTLAQKKGLSIDNQEYKSLSIIHIDPESNSIIIGDSSSLIYREFILKDYSFIDLKLAKDSKYLKVKVRGIGVNPEGYCKISIIDENFLKVTLLEHHAWALAKGQSSVFFIDDYVVGGGVIHSYD